MALIQSYPFRAFPILKTPSLLSRPISHLLHTNLLTLRRHVTLTTSSITWDDVIKISHPEPDNDEASDLSGYSDKIKACNRGAEMQSEYRPFVIEDQVVGYVHKEFVENLRSYADMFVFPWGRVALNSSLRSAEERTKAVGEVVNSLGEEVFPGIRNEFYPVTSAFGAPVHFSLERAAAPFFGIKAYGTHMCGYVEKEGEKYLWVAKRSQQKPTYPGMLDHLVAGGLIYYSRKLWISRFITKFKKWELFIVLVLLYCTGYMRIWGGGSKSVKTLTGRTLMFKP